jgi:hypothetical protein
MNAISSLNVEINKKSRGLAKTMCFLISALRYKKEIVQKECDVLSQP